LYIYNNTQCFITIGDIDTKSNCSCLFSDIDECDSNPCKNGATCTDHIDGFNCSCVAGYTGNMCETGMAECWMTRSDLEVRFRGDGDIDDGDKFGVFPHGHELST